MPFHCKVTKVQPINANGVAYEPTAPIAIRQPSKSRLHHLFFDRPFSLKNLATGVDQPLSGEFEPSLGKLVDDYIEEETNNVKPPRRGGRNGYNCFNGSGTDSSDEEEDYSSRETLRKIRNLVRSTNESEEILVERATEFVVDDDSPDSRLKAVVDGLVALGYDAAICKSSWKASKSKASKSTKYPAGEYEYLDVMIGGERVLIDIDFKSKFEIARPTETYKSISQTLPYVFVGQVDRLRRIVVVVSKAAKKSLKKNLTYVPPWRRSNFVMTKWLAPHVRGRQNQAGTGGDAGGDGNVVQA